MGKMKKILSALTAAAMTFSMAAGTMTAGVPTVTAAGKTAVEIVDDMGMGWNLGNTFDAWGVTWTDETWTGWGNSMPTKDLFAALHAEGFDSVRIPITWYQHTDASTYDIDDAYLERIKTVVDYARAADMYVIINMHWDWESGKSLWLNKGLDAQPQFTTMWTEIANYFKDYDQHLIFEDMNEVGWDNPYGYTDNDYKIVNTLNAKFVETIRATGGNNNDRLLLLAGANTDLDQTCSTKFEVPNDPMLAVSIHYYRPSTFCVAEVGAAWGYRDTWGTSADINAVYNDFTTMKSRFVDKGIPVILGESGVANAGKFNKDTESIYKFLKTVNSTALNTSGISCFLWDDSGHGDLSYFDRVNLTWFDSEVGKIFNELSGGGSSDGPTFSTKNRVTLNFSDIPVEKDAYMVDLSPYGAQDAKLTSVILNGTVTGGDYVGFGLGFDAYRDGNSTSQWSSETIQIKSDGSAVTEFDGKSSDEDGDYTYEINMDYLQVQQWWADGDATADLKTITLVFDKEISVIDSGTEDPTDPAEETTAPAEETTAPAEETTAPAEETTEPAEETTEAPVKEPEGLYVALEGQYAGNAFWEPIYYVDNIPETGTGSYSITVDKLGTTKAGDLILFLESNINIYDYKNDPTAEDESTGLTDGNIKLNITSILVDGVEVEYTAVDPGTSDDGKSLRQNIYNTYAKVTSIDPAITVSEGITVNFDLTLTKGGTSEETTAPAEETTAPAEETTAPAEETTLPPVPSTNVVYGDVNGDGTVDIMDVILLNKQLLGCATISKQGRANADVDADTKITTTDSLNILKCVVEMIDRAEFPLQ